MSVGAELRLAVVVLGASRGIGRAIARVAARDGDVVDEVRGLKQAGKPAGISIAGRAP